MGINGRTRRCTASCPFSPSSAEALATPLGTTDVQKTDEPTPKNAPPLCVKKNIKLRLTKKKPPQKKAPHPSLRFFPRPRTPRSRHPPFTTVGVGPLHM